MLGLLLGIVLSLLPKRYRDRLPASAGANLRSGALLSGVLQFLFCLAAFVVRYLIFIQEKVGELGERALARGAEEVLGTPAVQYGMGYVSMVEYLLHPLTLLLIYFTVEGVVRVYAAAITEEIVGTLPLYLIAWVEEQWGAARAERALGPRVRDIVEQVYSPDYDLRIFSCRRKLNWDCLITVAHEGQFYEVVAEEQGKPPYWFVYRLRKSKPGRVIRLIHHYDPAEVLLKKEKGSTKPSSRVMGSIQAQPGQNRVGQELSLPVPDLVQRIPGGNYQLRIASCRPKPTWDHLMTVEFEEEFYEVVMEEQGSPPYPYVYLLRKLPPGKIIRAVHHYRPDEPSLQQ